MNETQPTNTTSKPNRSITWIVLGIALLLVLAGLFFGYRSGIAARKDAAAAQVKQALGEQLILAQDDFNSGRYDVARQRVEWVLQQDPQYAGAAELLTETLLKLSATATPAASPTPEVSPTPDLRGAEELFTQANQFIATGDWGNAQTALDQLRKNSPEFKTAQVDGLYFILLRNRGIFKLAPSDGSPPNLEAGIYDLTLAEHFGPLDNYSAGLRNFARIYLTGLSFWDVDWQQAFNFFSQVAPYLPNLSDGSFTTARERYAYAAAMYAEKIANEGRPCDAVVFLDEVKAIASSDLINTVYNEANTACIAAQPPTPTPTPTLDPALVTPEVTTEVPPAETPTETLAP